MRERLLAAHHQAGSTPQAGGSQMLGARTTAERHLELIRKCRFSGPAHLHEIDKPGAGLGGGCLAICMSGGSSRALDGKPANPS